MSDNGSGNPAKVRIELVPLGAVLEVDRGTVLDNVLMTRGMEFPCGGLGTCGGCRVQVIEGSIDVSPEDQSVLSKQELADGWRLACRAHAESPLKLKVEQWTMPVLTDDNQLARTRRTGLVVAIDLGTTTVVAQLLDLASGKLLGLRTGLNPQTIQGADVMSRVRFAQDSNDLTVLIRDFLGTMIHDVASGREEEIVEVVLVGNTVMHHLFCGLDTEPLTHVPFASPNLGEQQFVAKDLGWRLPASAIVRFLPCIGGFVGSDILAGIVAVGLHTGTELRALIDLGTNGEISLGNRDKVLCASTAAGSAFEAGSIKMGMRAATGAISRVFLNHNEMECTVIGDVEPRGICGSGLVDAIAAGLDAGIIGTSGRFTTGSKELPSAAPSRFGRLTGANCNWPKEPSPPAYASCLIAGAPPSTTLSRSIWRERSATMSAPKARSGLAFSKPPPITSLPPATPPCAEPSFSSAWKTFRYSISSSM